MLKLSRHSFRAAVATVAFCLVAGAWADTIIKTDGQVVSGIVEGEGASSIRLRIKGSVVSLSRSMIREIIRESPQQNQLMLVHDELGRGEVSRALSHIDAFDSGSVSLDLVDKQLLSNERQILKVAPMLSVQEAAGFAAYVRQRTVPASDQLRLLFAGFLQARGNGGAAVDEVSSMSLESIRTNVVLRTRAVAVLRNALNRCLEAQDPETAVRAMSVMADLAPESARSSLTIVYVAEAERLAKAGRYDTALALLRDKVQPVAPGLAFTEAMRTLQSSDENTSLVERADLYRVFEDSFATAAFKDESAGLLRQQVAVLLQLGRRDDAASTALHLSSIDPDAGAEQEHLVEFETRYATIASTNSLELYKLASWAREMGLDDKAQALLEPLRGHPEIGENVVLQLNVIRFAREKRDFDNVTKLFEEEKIPEAIAAAEAFRRKYTEGELYKRAGTMVEMGRYEEQRRKAAHPSEAAALEQNAERLFYQGRYEEARGTTDRILADYSDTPAAKVATELKQRIDVALRTPGARPRPLTPRHAPAIGNSQTQSLRELMRIAGEIADRPAE